MDALALTKSFPVERMEIIAKGKPMLCRVSLVQSIAMALYLERNLLPKKPDTAGDYDSMARAIGARLTVSGWQFEKRAPRNS